MGSLRAQLFKAEGSSNDVGCVRVAFREGKVGVGDSKPTAPVPCWVHRSRVGVRHGGRQERGVRSVRVNRASGRALGCSARMVIARERRRRGVDGGWLIGGAGVAGTWGNVEPEGRCLAGSDPDAGTRPGNTGPVQLVPRRR